MKLLLLISLLLASCGQAVRYKPAYDELKMKGLNAARIQDYDEETAEIVLEGITCNDAFDFLRNKFIDTDIECETLKEGVIVLFVELEDFREFQVMLNKGKGNAVR